MGWRAVLCCGLDVALINCITALDVARLIEPVVQGLLLCTQVPSEKRTFRSTTVIIALNGVLTAVNVIHRRSIVMKERKSVLPLSIGLPSGSHGPRYASVGACAHVIYTEEGLRGFFVGLEFCLVVNVLLPLLQTLARGTVYLPHVDTANVPVYGSAACLHVHIFHSVSHLTSERVGDSPSTEEGTPACMYVRPAPSSPFSP